MVGDKISLDGLIAKRGLRKDMIADELGIVPSALSHKIEGTTLLCRTEIKGVIRDTEGTYTNHQESRWTDNRGSESLAFLWHPECYVLQTGAVWGVLR